MSKSDQVDVQVPAPLQRADSVLIPAFPALGTETHQRSIQEIGPGQCLRCWRRHARLPCLESRWRHVGTAESLRRSGARPRAGRFPSHSPRKRSDAHRGPRFSGSSKHYRARDDFTQLDRNPPDFDCARSTNGINNSNGGDDTYAQKKPDSFRPNRSSSMRARGWHDHGTAVPNHRSGGAEIAALRAAGPAPQAPRWKDA